ncbi:MAG: glycosyltransferase [Bacteroidota bacterium]
MKVIQTNKAYWPLIGGVETIVTGLAEGLRAHQGVEVSVLACNHVRSLRCTVKEIRGVSVTYAPMWTTIASLPISPAYPFLLRRRTGDILHVHEPFPLADLSLTFWPRIRKNFRRLVVTWHSDIVRQKWALASYTPVIHRLLDAADCILVASENNIGISKFLPLYREKCRVIPFGLNLAWRNHREDRRAKVEGIRATLGTPLILFVGRLVYYKGLRYLLEALSILPEGQLVIIGSGPLLPELLKHAETLGIQKRVTFMPHLPDEELYAHYEACDIFVLPSTEVSEAFGLVQIEAMACGKPVVSTDLGTGVNFVNRTGETGLTVAPRDARALADAIKRLIHDVPLRSRLGQNAQKRVHREFSASRMIERTVDLYQTLLSR